MVQVEVLPREGRVFEGREIVIRETRTPSHEEASQLEHISARTSVGSDPNMGPDAGHEIVACGSWRGSPAELVTVADCG